MKDFLGFTRRNLIIYFKDILAIFFSLLTSIIVFVLYLFTYPDNLLADGHMGKAEPLPEFPVGLEVGV